jgi:hypothetical protein
MGSCAEMPYRELRALWDMSGFVFEDLAEAKVAWLMLEITPALDSGTTSGMHIDGSTGQIVREPGKNLEVVVKGTVHQLVRFDGKACSPVAETYSWGAPVMTRTKDVQRILYLPFRSGGTILSQFWGVATREDQFEPYCVVPKEWSGTLSSYLDLRKMEGSHRLKLENKEDRLHLAKQLAGTNPIVALEAFRILRVTGRLKDDAPDYVPPKPAGLVKSADLASRALLITDLLRVAHSLPNVEDESKNLVMAATDLQQLRPIAMAARSVLYFVVGPHVQESKKVSFYILADCLAATEKLQGDVKLREELQMIINPGKGVKP